MKYHDSICDAISSIGTCPLCGSTLSLPEKEIKTYYLNIDSESNEIIVINGDSSELSIFMKRNSYSHKYSECNNYSCNLAFKVDYKNKKIFDIYISREDLIEETINNTSYSLYISHWLQEIRLIQRDKKNLLYNIFGYGYSKDFKLKGSIERLLKLELFR